MKRLLAVVALSFVGALMLAGPAFAYPNGNPSGTESVTSGPPGSSVTISGKNWAPGSTVTIKFDSSTTLGTATAGATGSFSDTVTIPSSAPLGADTIALDGTSLQGAPAVVDLTFTVTSSSGTGLAFTGANISLGTLLVVVLVVIGFGALFAGRRRRAGTGRERETADR